MCLPKLLFAWSYQIFDETQKLPFQLSISEVSFNPTWHKLFFGGLDMGGGLEEPPPGKHPSGTSMTSNDLVTHQAHKNGQF